MKKIKLSLADLLSVLEQLAHNECEEIIIYESAEGYPVIVDAGYPDDVITFGPLTEEDMLPKGEANEDLH